MLHLDGSLGEGGGQVLRTALGLSLCTGQPFAIDRIRAGRKNPGLARQHLTAVLAAAAVGNADVGGAELGSTSLQFRPRGIRGGAHRFAVGTAGSTTLVLQTVLPALLRAAEPSTLSLAGGTHNPLAPSFDFLQQVFAPVLRRMGAQLDLRLVRHGFAPAGGGEFRADVTPGPLAPIELRHRVAGRPHRARALLANLPDRIGERELQVVRQRLGLDADHCRLERVAAAGPGNVLLLELPAEPCGELIAVPGERQVTAEQVAERACAAASAWLAADVPVGEHLADQLLIPLALAGGGAFRTLAPTEHTRTNAAIVEHFLPVRFTLREDERAGAWWIEAAGR
ncbi:MAG: RNA 3'-terminal phosphate cyclase [Planctomycetes bacterium]|nr:RNA 3'-terminal phosphate cyclase [Planctomycetota bacterium]